jgi:hypothetical protein
VWSKCAIPPTCLATLASRFLGAMLAQRLHVRAIDASGPAHLNRLGPLQANDV